MAYDIPIAKVVCDKRVFDRFPPLFVSHLVLSLDGIHWFGHHCFGISYGQKRRSSVAVAERRGLHRRLKLKTMLTRQMLVACMWSVGYYLP